MFSEIMFMIYVLSSMLESCMLGLILVMINLVRNLNLQLSIYPTLIGTFNLCNCSMIVVIPYLGVIAYMWPD